MSMVVLVVAATEAERARFAARHADRRLMPLVNQGREPLARLGNALLEESAVDVVGLAHADCEFGPGALDAFGEAARAGLVCGLVGRDLAGAYRWARSNPGRVSTLDCCAVFLRRDLGLRFDAATFDGYHCHVEDLCLQAAQRGIPVEVPAAEASHPVRTLHTTDLAEWMEQYRVYRARLAAKWAGVEFQTT